MNETEPAISGKHSVGKKLDKISKAKSRLQKFMYF